MGSIGKLSKKATKFDLEIKEIKSTEKPIIIDSQKPSTFKIKHIESNKLK
jgi:hypothetical protein